MPTVWLPNAKQKTVSRRWLDGRFPNVDFVKVHPCSTDIDAHMILDLVDGRKFIADWDDRQDCWRWLHRPSLYGVSVNWFGEPYIIQTGNRNRSPEEVVFKGE